MLVYGGDVFYLGLSCDAYNSFNATTGEFSDLIGRMFTNKIFYIPTYKSGSLPSGTSATRIENDLNFWIDRVGSPLIGSVTFNNTDIPVSQAKFDKIRQVLPQAVVIETNHNSAIWFKVFDPHNPNTFVAIYGSTYYYWLNGVYIGARPSGFIPFWNSTNSPDTTNGAIIAQTYDIEHGQVTLARWVNVGTTGNTSVWTRSGTDIAFTTWLNGVSDYEPEPTDPYNPGGDTGQSGGTGDFDNSSDSVNIPGLPSVSAVDTGFITLFNPALSELRDLANYMWGSLFDIDTWKKLFADPMDAILGLSIVPVSVPNGGQTTVTVGNISTGISMNKAGSQYVAVDCGTLNVNEYWGAYLDYDPYTKAEIYLPYIGTHPLAVDDIMGKSVHVVYHVDVLSGACVAYVQCGSSVLYNFVGQCSCSIPITGNDWTNVVNGALSIAASIGSMVATGGASAPLAATAIASTAVNTMKPNVEKSNSLGGMGGMLGIQKPYIILTRPRQALPKNQNKYSGYPSFITRKLSGLSGYTEIDSIHLDGIPATEQELSEIESLLKSGVIL